MVLPTTPGQAITVQLSGGDLVDPLRALEMGQPGDIIWAAPYKAVPGAKAWKALYHSRSIVGTPTAEIASRSATLVCV